MNVNSIKDHGKKKKPFVFLSFIYTSYILLIYIYITHRIYKLCKSSVRRAYLFPSRERTAREEREKGHWPHVKFFTLQNSLLAVVKREREAPFATIYRALVLSFGVFLRLFFSLSLVYTGYN